VLLAGEVGLMDQPAQHLGDLGWPVCLGIDLTGPGKITEQMSVTPDKTSG